MSNSAVASVSPVCMQTSFGPMTRLRLCGWKYAKDLPTWYGVYACPRLGAILLFWQLLVLVEDECTPWIGHTLHRTLTHTVRVEGARGQAAEFATLGGVCSFSSWRNNLNEAIFPFVLNEAVFCKYIWTSLSLNIFICRKSERIFGPAQTRTLFQQERLTLHKKPRITVLIRPNHSTPQNDGFTQTINSHTFWILEHQCYGSTEFDRFATQHSRRSHTRLQHHFEIHPRSIWL